MRQFGYNTVKDIVNQVRSEFTKHNKDVSISRSTFYNLEKSGLFESKRTTGRWRRYTDVEAKLIVKLILDNYGIEELEEPI